MLESEQKQLNDFNRQLAVAEAECVELKEKIRKIGKRISELKKRVKNLKKKEK